MGASATSRKTLKKGDAIVTEPNRAGHVDAERAILAGVERQGTPHAEDPLGELRGLAQTAGAMVVGEFSQRRERPDVATYLGRGKVDELKLAAERWDAQVALFDNNLTPAQTRNLERSTGMRVVDRTELILDIFASRAQTYEARLAVELAQLQYALPRLKRMWTHLSRIKRGIGMRGPGEKQLEVDRRLVEKRIHELQQELSGVERRKERQVASRSEYTTVSLVGYTNAGKSTLMNALTHAGVLAQDKLFATLDTRTRRWNLPSLGSALLSDTVGFIRDLPSHLIASFKATLEETRKADLLLHVADASSPTVLDQISSVNRVFEELQILDKPTLLVFNKMDAVADCGTLNALLDRYPNAIAVSARTGINLDHLAQAVNDALSREFLDLEIEGHVSAGELLAFVAAHGEVKSKQFTETRLVIHCRLPRPCLHRILKLALSVRNKQGEELCHPAGAELDAR